MNTVTYDTFISYRRNGGSQYAGTVYDYLFTKNFYPFYDRTGMENGRFDEQIRINLINSENYILILSLNALDRTVNEDDWVAKEIELAIENNLNIIVIAEEGFSFPDELPQKIAGLKLYQLYYFKHNSLSECLKEIEPKLQRKANIVDYFDPDINGKIKFGGDYITVYEDEDNGRIVTRKAPAHIFCFGNTIFGKTSFNDSQAWKIRGKIYKKRRITGLYYAESKLDDGIGTFYLEVKSPSIFEGYWCGYDNVNKKLLSGKYIFKRIFSDYTLRAVQQKDLPYISRMSDIQLGKNYVTAKSMKKALEDENYFCLVAENKNNNHVIGFVSFSVMDYSEASAVAKGKGVSNLQFIDRIGYVKTVVVDKKYEGYGIASRLVGECLDELREKGCDAFISTAWKHGGITNIANVLENKGFEKAADLPNYWYEDSEKEGYLCPKCGNPCHCSCVIYIKV